MFNLVGMPTNMRYENVFHLKFANRVIDRRLQKAIHWYRNNYYYIAGQHILYKLIENFGLPETLPDEYIEQYIHNRAFTHGNAMGLSSHRDVGKLHYGKFYGPNTTEVIVQIEQRWSWDYVKQHWQDLAPVTVLRHDQNHISYNLMTPKNYIEHRGFAIIQIDINLLHMQYHAWRQHHRNIKTMNPDHTVPKIGYFLGMVVLPNMLPSHFNQVIINKHCMFTDEWMSKTMDYMGTSFYINNNSQELDNDIANLEKQFANNNFDIVRIARNIHGVGDTLAYEFQDTPRIHLTRNNKWIYVLAISRFLRHCLLVPNNKVKETNRNYINRLKFELISLKGGKVFYDYRISDLRELYDEEVDWLFSL